MYSEQPSETFALLKSIMLIKVTRTEGAHVGDVPNSVEKTDPKNDETK